jgi:hypothetical protein
VPFGREWADTELILRSWTCLVEHNTFLSHSGDIVARHKSRTRYGMYLDGWQDGESPLGVGSHFRKIGGEAEAPEGAWGEKGSDLLDLRTAEGEHVHGVRREGLCLVVPGVSAEG